MTRVQACVRLGSTVLVIASVLLSGCGGGGAVPPQRAASVVIAPGALLFTEAGESAVLVATVTDSTGAPRDESVTWSSSDPSVVEVDQDGKLTTHAALGSATITASAGGVASFPALVIVAQPATGAVLLADDQVQGPPTPVEGTVNPIQQRVVVSGAANLEPGTLIIGSQAVSIGGRVVSATPTAGGVEIIYAPLPPQDLFKRLSINADFDLAAAPVVPAEDVAGQLVVRSHSGGTTTFGPANTLQPAALGIECEGRATYVSISGLNTTLENGLRYHLHLQDGVTDPRPTELYVDGNLTQKVSGGLNVKAGYSGTYTCKKVFFRIPIPIAGVAALVARPVVPVGVAASVTGSITAAALSVNLEASSGLDLKAGFTYDEAGGLTLLHDVTPKPGSPDLTFDLVTPAGFRVGASGFVGLASGVELQIAGLADIELVQAQLGAQQSFDLASAEAQADSSAYASAYDLSLVASVGIGADLDKLLSWLGIGVSAQVAQFQETYPISKSPSGTFTASATNAVPGDQVHLHVALDADHLTYLGHYNVGKVLIYMSQGSDEPTLFRTIPLSASNQSDFDTVWDTTGLAGGEYRFQAFVVDDLLAKVVEVPLEVTANSTVIVNLAGVCVAGLGLSLEPMAACTGGTSYDYSQPDTVNGIAWDVHTTGAGLTWVQDPQNPQQFNLTGATVSWTDQADYTAGCSITSSGDNLRVVNTDPNLGTYVSGLLVLSPDGTYYGSGYVYVAAGADDGCMGGKKDENVPLFQTGNPSPTVVSDGAGGSLLAGSAAFTSDVGGSGTSSWDFRFPDLAP